MSFDDFENYYDGPLELRPFLRAWARDRWARLRSFVRYRVLRRPRPVLPPYRPSATMATVSEIYKQQYGAEAVEHLSRQAVGVGAWATLMKREKEASDAKWLADASRDLYGDPGAEEPKP